MKKEYLILIIAVLLSFGCQKREVVDPNINPASNDGLIELRSGATLSSRVANKGIRVEKFQTGDKIGVMAVFVDTEAFTENPGDGLLPNWADTMHFDNAPAAFSSYDATESLSLFNWGESGEGGINNRYYPSRIRDIYLVGYYPYSVDNYTSGDPKSQVELERHPKLSIVLTDDMVSPPVVPTPVAGTETPVEDVYTKGNHLNQADILRYADYNKNVTSTSPLASMPFSHVLAQFRFTLERSTYATICYFRKIEFHTAKRGVLDLAAGDFIYDDDIDAREAFYRFDFLGETAPVIPIEGQLGAPYDVLNPSYSTADAPTFNYPMVLPLPKEIGKLGSIKLYTTQTAAADDDVYQVYDIPLDGLPDFTAGGLNTMNITILKAHVELKGTIEAWGTGSQAELPAE